MLVIQETPATDHFGDLPHQAARATPSASSSHASETSERVKDLRACLSELRRSETHFEKMAGGATWREIAAFVRKMSEAMIQTLPSFWRIARHYADGKLLAKKGSGSSATSKVSERVVAQCRAWAAESIEEFVSLLSHFFSLTDAAILMQRALSPLPEWVPHPTSFSTAASFMRTMLEDLTEVTAEIDALQIGGSASSGLYALLHNVRFSFTEVLCQLWRTDTQTLLKLEDWALEQSGETNTTLFLNDVALMHRSNARLVYLVAGGRDLLPGTARPKEAMVKSEFVARVKSTFVQVLRDTLEGMADLAIAEYDPTHSEMPLKRRAVKGSLTTVDVTDLDVRVLLSITNIAHMNSILLPSMLKQFSEAFSTVVKDEAKALKDQCSRIDVSLFEGYIQRRSANVCGILRRGILESGVDWKNLPKPTEVHPFIYEALLEIVQVHAQVRAAAKQLVDRAITAVLERLAAETLRDFRQVATFGMGGMLQATLEIEFIHQTLSQFVSPPAEKTLKDVYETISERYQRKSPDETELLKNELEVVKKTLVASRKATALQFLCFRRTRTRDKDKDQGDRGASKAVEARA